MFFINFLLSYAGASCMAGLLFKKVTIWIWLIGLVLVAACSSTQPWWKGKPITQMTPAEIEEQDPMFWRDWGSAHGLGR
jgi:hypothetical protein